MKSKDSVQTKSRANDRMLKMQAPPDFLDSALEWRRMFAETWGTFLLVLVAAGGGVVRDLSGGSLSLAMIVIAPGLMVMAIIYFMGTVSGAHLNPAVTLAFAVRGNFPWRRVPGYFLAQVIGGIAAAVFLRAMFGNAGSLGATVPGIGIGGVQAMVMEVVLTAGLVNTILGTSSGRAQYRHQRCSCGRCLHRPFRALGFSHQRGLDESRAITCT